MTFYSWATHFRSARTVTVICTLIAKEVKPLSQSYNAYRIWAHLDGGIKLKNRKTKRMTMISHLEVTGPGGEMYENE